MKKIWLVCLAAAMLVFSFCGYGVEKNYSEAVKWYRKAAEQGDADAQFNLGACYFLGNGVEKNDSEAVKWWRRAAEQGNAKAQEVLRCLGIFYSSDLGTASAIKGVAKLMTV